MDKFEELDGLIDKLVEECYTILANDDTQDTKQVLRIACYNLCRKSKTTQGIGIIDKQGVLFEVEDGAAFPIFPVENDNDYTE
jgi:hypothetical protein